MGSSELSHKLLDLGFFSALGTTETVGAGEKRFVERQSPRTLDINNGVMVVVDDEGRPWIMKVRRMEMVAMYHDVFTKFNFRRGTYVPHSNDGGHFVDDVLPALLPVPQA